MGNKDQFCELILVLQLQLHYLSSEDNNGLGMKNSKIGLWSQPEIA